MQPIHMYDLSIKTCTTKQDNKTVIECSNILKGLWYGITIEIGKLD